MNHPVGEAKFPDVKRVLIYRLGSLGDTLVALPALHLVASVFPNARRLMLTNKPVHTKAPAASAVIGDSGLVHGYIEYPVGTRNLRELLKLWWQIVRFRPQWVIYLAAYRGDADLKRDEKFFKLCGATQIAGIRSEAVASRLYFPEQDLWEHEAPRLLRRLEEFGSPSCHNLSLWDLRLNPNEEERASVMLAPLAGRPLIACGPGTKMQAKDWGRERWRALIKRLNEYLPGCGLVMVGAKEDSEVCEDVASAWKGPVLNLCGMLSPRETGGVLRHARCFLGPDSGPMHLAAASGVPCVIAFASRTLPGIWFPFGDGHRVIFHKKECSNCGLTTCIEEQKRCLTSIGVDEMLRATLDVWSNSGGRAEQEILGGGRK